MRTNAFVVAVLSFGIFFSALNSQFFACRSNHVGSLEAEAAVGSVNGYGLNYGLAATKYLPSTTLLLLGNEAPVVTATPKTISPGNSIPVSNLFSAMDPDGDAITQYQFLVPPDGSSIDLNGAANLLDSFSQSQGFYGVAASDLARVSYVAGNTEGTEVMTVWAFDGTVWGVGSVNITILQPIIGSWAMNGYETGTITIAGQTIPIQSSVSDTFVFGADHSFHAAASDIGYGTWAINSSDPNACDIDVRQAIVDYMRNGLAAEGVTGYMTITSYSFRCYPSSGVMSSTLHVEGTVTTTSPAVVTGYFSMQGNYSGAKISTVGNRVAAAPGLPSGAAFGNSIKSILLENINP